MINAEDITLSNFLKKFTYIGDADAGSKIQLEIGLFLQTAALLKLELSIQRIRRTN